MPSISMASNPDVMPMSNKLETLLAAAEELKKRALQGSAYEEAAPQEEHPKKAATPVKAPACKKEQRTPAGPPKKLCKTENQSPGPLPTDYAASVVSSTGSPKSRGRSHTPGRSSKRRRTKTTPTPEKAAAPTPEKAAAPTPEKPAAPPPGKAAAATPGKAAAATPGKAAAATPERPASKAPTPEKATKAPTPEKATKAPTPEKTTKAPTPEKTTKAPTPEKAAKAPTPEKATKAPTPEKTTTPEKAGPTPHTALESAAAAARGSVQRPDHMCAIIL